MIVIEIARNKSLNYSVIYSLFIYKNLQINEVLDSEIQIMIVKLFHICIIRELFSYKMASDYE